MRIQALTITTINATSGTQMRSRIDQAHVARCVEGIESLPPIVVFSNGTDHYLADGFHRLIAHVQAERDSIVAEVHEGGIREARLFAVGANHSHGLPRTDDDKRICVTRLLEDAEWANRSSRMVAEKCRVSSWLVDNIRNNKVYDVLNDEPSIEEPPLEPEVRVGKDGKERPVVATPKAKPIEDKLGVLIEDLEIAEVFKRSDGLQKIAAAINDAKNLVKKAIAAKDEVFDSVPWQRVEAACETAFHALRAARPHALCPWCRGIGRQMKNCKACKNRGWQSKSVYQETTPSELKP